MSENEGFKTASIGSMTPEVMISQIAELKWKGLVVIGILRGEDPTGQGNIPFAYNSCGLSAMEFGFLTRHLEARALDAVREIEDVPPGHFK